MQALLAEAVKLHGTEPKLWLMSGQLAEQQGDDKRAEAAYNEGTKHCPTSTPLWIFAAALQTKKSELLFVVRMCVCVCVCVCAYAANL